MMSYGVIIFHALGAPFCMIYVSFYTSKRFPNCLCCLLNWPPRYDKFLLFCLPPFFPSFFVLLFRSVYLFYCTVFTLPYVSANKSVYSIKKMPLVFLFFIFTFGGQRIVKRISKRLALNQVGVWFNFRKNRREVCQNLLAEANYLGGRNRSQWFGLGKELVELVLVCLSAITNATPVHSSIRNITTVYQTRENSDQLVLPSFFTVRPTTYHCCCQDFLTVMEIGERIPTKWYIVWWRIKNHLPFWQFDLPP